MKLLVVVDMQNDFITGSLANPEAQKIVPAVAEYIKNFDGVVITTHDTHYKDYLDTQEGKKLPVEHCIEYSKGWELDPAIKEAVDSLDVCRHYCIGKKTFGSTFLADEIKDWDNYGFNGNPDKIIDGIEFCGVCTDICVISNVLLTKAAAPEIPIYVHKNLCAGVTPESHENALKAMAACQVNIID